MKRFLIVFVAVSALAQTPSEDFTKAVFFGQKVGTWQKDEHEALLSESKKRHLPVIPVILETARHE